MARPDIRFREKDHTYWINGEMVPSVTTVLGVLNKPALAPWAAKATVEGVVKLARTKGYTFPVKTIKDRSGRDVSPEKQLKTDLARRKLDHKSKTDDSIVRGIGTHKALEDWITQRRIPVLSEYPTAHRGYIVGLAKFLLEWRPQFVESELIVGSVTHRFAGRRDSVGVIEHGHHGRAMLDLKTSKRVYPDSMYPQLSGYELAGVECGEPPTDKQGILRVGADGSYEVAWSTATPKDFLAILGAYRALEGIRERIKAQS